METIVRGVSSQGHFWDLSEIILSKINDRNHDSYANFMSSNPMVSKYKGINVTRDSLYIKIVNVNLLFVSKLPLCEMEKRRENMGLLP